MTFRLLAFSVVCVLSFGPRPLSGADRDIFTNEKETRRPAQDREFEIALGINGCAGSLIGPNIGLSAAHCKMSGPIKSGMALKRGLPADGRIGKTLEIGSPSKFDYWVFEIQWNAGTMPAGMRLVPSVQREQDELKTGANETSDKIFTLGFPADIAKGKLIHSWGYGKQWSTDSLINNISLINGNSGGIIARESDEMLVSIVSGGPHAFGQPGWKGNDWNDASHFNVGPAMYLTYASSTVLKQIFPGGKNKFLSAQFVLEMLPLAGIEYLRADF